jgi:hypothetical protein
MCYSSFSLSMSANIERLIASALGDDPRLRTHSSVLAEGVAEKEAVARCVGDSVG